MDWRAVLFLWLTGLTVTSLFTAGDNPLEMDLSNKTLRFILPDCHLNVTKLILNDNSIELSYSDVETLRKLPRLTELYLDKNSLTNLSGNVLSSLSQLRVLQVSNNHITELDSETFSGLTKLETLDLSGNLITSLPEDLFRGLGNLKTLHLQDNKLQTLENTTFSGLDKLQKLDLEGNPWNCSCWLIKQIRRLNESGVEMSKDMRCSSPKAYAGHSILKEGRMCYLTSSTPTTPAVNTNLQSTTQIKPSDASKTTNSSKDSATGGQSGSMPVVGNTWKFLVGVVVIALSTSMLIVCAVKSPSLYKLVFNYRHQRLHEEEEPGVFATGRMSNFSLDTQQTETSAQELEEGLEHTLEVQPHEEEDGFIEDRYIETGDYRDQSDLDEL